MCSISHSIADGHTFYTIQSMLSQSPESGVRAMIAARVTDFEQRVDSFMAGGNDTAAFLRSLHFHRGLKILMLSVKVGMLPILVAF